MPQDTDFQLVTAESLQRIDEIFTLANTFKTDTLTRMDTMITQATTLVDTLSTVAYSPTFDTHNLTYSSPSSASAPDYSGTGPAAPTLDSLNAHPTFSYTDGGYTDLLKTEIDTALSNVFGGTTIVPTAIWDAIYTRAKGKLTLAQTGRDWEASNFGANLGWSYPSQVTNARLDRSQEQTDRETIALVVEQAIQEARERHTDYWNAVQQGVAFENIWIQEYQQREGRALEAAVQAVTQANAINQLIIASNDLDLREYGIKWETPLKYIAEETKRFAVLVQEASQDIDSERTRLGYEQAKLDKGFRTEDGDTNFEVQRAQLGEVLTNALSQVANFMAAMAQGALAASDVSVGTGTSYGYDENLQL